MKHILKKIYHRIFLPPPTPPTVEPSAGKGNFVLDDLIVCNFCSTIFPRSGPDHSEFLACPYCSAIARERVAYHAMLHEICEEPGAPPLFFNQAKELSQIRLLECSPRFHPNRRSIYEKTLNKYMASDFDMSAHRADIQMDLTSEQHVAPFEQAFDVIICSHVLEHIPDYHAALLNLQQMLAPSGLLVLQVPLLEGRYTPVTWDEFHGDNTRVYHRFGFDLVKDLEPLFSKITPVVGRLDFPITSPEIKADKYAALAPYNEHCLVIGESMMHYSGLGMPDLCDAILARK
jgi:SAM-dependent methyltransferase